MKSCSFNRPLVALCLSLAATSLGFSQNSIVSLGSASNYAVLGLGLNLSEVNVHGDTGVASNGKISVGTSSTLAGDLYMGSGALIRQGGTVTGTVYQPFDVDLAMADVAAASQLAAGLTADYVFASVTGPLVITSTGLQTVINVTGDLNLSGSDSLFFSGGAADKFILNVFGGFTLDGNSVVSGQRGMGIDGSDVIVNVIGTGSTVTSNTGNYVNGSLIATQRAMELQGTSGAVYGGSSDLVNLLGGSTVNGQSFQAVPEPNAAMLVGIAGVMLLVFRRR